ncbi:hypothetical protein [Mycobacteroides chelonae]
MGGKRKPKIDYHVWIDYSLGWRENRDCKTSMWGDLTEAEAMQSAIEQTDEMRRRGAESPVRSVRVTRWESDTSLISAPVLYEASYYDAEQKLTDAQVFAARVHDWHEFSDRFNANNAGNRSKWRVGYGDWPNEWGQKPITCPACNTVVGPQKVY